MKKKTFICKTIIYATIFLLLFFNKDLGLSANNRSSSLVNTTITLPNYSLGNFTVIKHDTSVIIDSINNISVEEIITIFNNQNSTKFLYFGYNANYLTDLLITDIEGNNLSYSFNNTDLLEIELNTQLNLSHSLELTLNYKSLSFPESLEKIGKQSSYVFTFLKYFSYKTEVDETSIRLPPGYYINEAVQAPVVPLTYTDQPSGNILFLYWDHTNQPAESSIPFRVFFKEPLYPSTHIWAYIVGPLLGMILGGVVVYLWMKKGTKKLEAEIEQIYLTKNQQILLKLIEFKEGKTTQQDLIKTTNFTKSKVSRNLTPLEENGLIIKEKWGKQYKVSLTNKGEKVAETIVVEQLHISDKLSKTNFSKEKKTNIEMRKDEDQ